MYYECIVFQHDNCNIKCLYCGCVVISGVYIENAFESSHQIRIVIDDLFRHYCARFCLVVIQFKMHCVWDSTWKYLKYQSLSVQIIRTISWLPFPHLTGIHPPPSGLCLENTTLLVFYIQSYQCTPILKENCAISIFFLLGGVVDMYIAT